MIPYEDEDDAITLANDSPNSLGGSVWSADFEHGLDVARKVQAGSIGREFSDETLGHYQQLKSIYLTG